ncbi:MAG: rRNA pseudouridine synthase [Clostridia bacterium]|nr:rRNA pseudouridine synthase [Clostridia bacterium]
MMDVKLQKYISDCGLMSRRAAEKEIAAGAFAVNGETASLGDRVDPKKDSVTYRGKPLKKPSGRKTYLILYKPAGIVTTMSDEHGRQTVADLVKDVPGRLYPVGRLDKDSEGLLILTDDGEFANRVAHPSGEIRKTYIAFLRGYVENNQLDRLRAMRVLEGAPILPVEVELLDRCEQVSRVRFVLSEGKNRQIRKMCEAAGLSVMQLKRIQIGGIHIGTLSPGEYRRMTPEEKKSLEHRNGPKAASADRKEQPCRNRTERKPKTSSARTPKTARKPKPRP